MPSLLGVKCPVPIKKLSLAGAFNAFCERLFFPDVQPGNIVSMKSLIWYYNLQKSDLVGQFALYWSERLRGNAGSQLWQSGQFSYGCGRHTRALFPPSAWCTSAGAEAFWCLARCAPGLVRVLRALCTRVETGDRGCNHLTQALTPAEYVEKPQEAAASTSDHPSSKAAPPRLLFLKGRDQDCAFNLGTPSTLLALGSSLNRERPAWVFPFKETWHGGTETVRKLLYVQSDLVCCPLR